MSLVSSLKIEPSTMGSLSLVEEAETASDGSDGAIDQPPSSSKAALRAVEVATSLGAGKTVDVVSGTLGSDQPSSKAETTSEPEGLAS